MGGGRDVRSSKQIDFAEYRNRIADTSFVDDLEVAYHVEKDTVTSISDMSTLDSWTPDAVQSFKGECEHNGDVLVKPLSAADKEKQAQSLQNAELYDEKMKLMAAETLEDIYTAKQTYLDYVMMPMHNDYVKKERLRQIQDEERRKAFLERWDTASKIYNGAESEKWY